MRKRLLLKQIKLKEDKDSKWGCLPKELKLERPRLQFHNYFLVHPNHLFQQVEPPKNGRFRSKKYSPAWIKYKLRQLLLIGELHVIKGASVKAMRSLDIKDRLSDSQQSSPRKILKIILENSINCQGKQ